ncbi:MAG: hypothetical protein ACK6D1_10170 [Planctomycetota bacterium]
MSALVEAMRTAIAKDLPGATLEEDATLCLLHFGKFRMWKDLQEHWPTFLERSNPGTWVTLLSGHMGDSWCWPCGRHRVPWPDAMDPDRAGDGATEVRTGCPAP